jgi:hypothetical protein
MHDDDSASDMIVPRPPKGRKTILLTMAWFGMVLCQVDVAAGEPVAQGSSGMAVVVTAPGQNRISPHILAARQRAASGQAGGQASHASAGLQAQMHKQAAKRQVVTRK